MSCENTASHRAFDQACRAARGHCSSRTDFAVGGSRAAQLQSSRTALLDCFVLRTGSPFFLALRRAAAVAIGRATTFWAARPPWRRITRGSQSSNRENPPCDHFGRSMYQAQRLLPDAVENAAPDFAPQSTFEGRAVFIDPQALYQPGPQRSTQRYASPLVGRDWRPGGNF
jgi:hypothetical protein